MMTMRLFIGFVVILALKLMNFSAAVSYFPPTAGNIFDSKTAKVYYVIPEKVVSRSDVSCLEIECHTLAFYMSNSIGSFPLFFRSNETYIFWSGTHKPLENVTLTISEVVNLNLFGNGATVDCKNEPVQFIFNRSSKITLQNLKFLSCIGKRNLNKWDIPLGLISFIDGFGLLLYKVQLIGSVYGAIYIKDTLGVVELREVMVANGNIGNQELPDVGNAIVYEQCFNQTQKLIIKDSIFTNNSNLVTGDNKRWNQKVIPLAGGLTIALKCESVHIEVSNLTMRNNSGGDGGNLGLIFSRNTFGKVTILGSRFESGYSLEGSGLYIDFNGQSNFKRPIYQNSASKTTCQDLLLQISDSIFLNNKVQYAGGGVYIIHRESDTGCGKKRVKITNCTFVKNAVIKSGFGGIALHSINLLVMTEYSVHFAPQVFIQLDGCEFKQNHMTLTDGTSGGTSVVFTKSNAYFHVTNTSITRNSCSGILVVSSNLILSGNILLVNNSASSGGGLLLCDDAVMYLKEYVHVMIANNTAKHAGGGISVESKCLQSKPMCFYQFGENVLRTLSLIKTIKVNLFNNYADYAGDNLFGGSVEYCFVIPNSSANINTFKTVFNISNTTVSSASSPPERVCLCQNSSHNCSIPDSSALRNKEVFPGQEFAFEVALVGQLNGLVKGAVWTHLIDPIHDEKLDNFVIKHQRIDTLSCKSLHYTVYSDQPHLILSLGVQHSTDISGFERLSLYEHLNVSIRINHCPLGFAMTKFNDSNGLRFRCDCIDLFRITDRFDLNFSCDINNQTIHKPNNHVWIGLTESGSIALHLNCPLDYCNKDILYVTVTNKTFGQDRQCSPNRTGIMCGACVKGYSVVLGGTECRQCSNYWLLMYIVFAFVGIALIFFLSLLNWTISAGTFSGIVFYCNIIWSNMSSFFPDARIWYLTPLLKSFVSLINLESSSSNCLYNGMDAYWHSWLRFILPLYVLVVAAVFVCLANRCSCIVRGNAVKVLASLILLSYTKLLYISIEAIHFSFLFLEDGTYETRWFLDGNVKYFKGKHIPLVIVASLFVILLLPFTFCLLCIQCLQNVSHYYLFSWVHRLKPFFDAYTGPFTSTARFWTGLLLLFRTIIYIASTVNGESDPKLNTGVISLAVLLLLSTALMLPGGLYRQHFLNILECWLLFNLGILSTIVTFSGMIHHKKRALHVVMITTHLCVGTAFITFTAIALYHTSRIKVVRFCWRYLKSHLLRRCSFSGEVVRDNNQEQNPELVPLFDEEREHES